jgi:hypothetical protein
MFKNTLRLFFGIALVVQLTGCLYWGDDHRWHGGHRDYHENHDPGVDVHLHG